MLFSIIAETETHPSSSSGVMVGDFLPGDLAIVLGGGRLHLAGVAVKAVPGTHHVELHARNHLLDAVVVRPLWVGRRCGRRPRPRDRSRRVAAVLKLEKEPGSNALGGRP